MMNHTDGKSHWEKIYQTKELKDVSWYQPTPETSLEFLLEIKLPKEAAIIDIGGGDSFFVDNLLNLGYTNITVLDISQSALEKAKQRLSDKASAVRWIVSDILDFNPTEKYDFWHDRAAFHFLTNENNISKYLRIAASATNHGSHLLIGTFSYHGPEKCSGLPIRQYNETEMTACFENSFSKIKCINRDHPTPFNTQQSFIFCSFKRKF